MYYILFAILLQNVFADRLLAINHIKCPAYRYGILNFGPFSHTKYACGDGTLLDNNRDCRYIQCNPYIQNCQGDKNICRNPSTMIPFTTGDIIGCQMVIGKHNIIGIQTTLIKIRAFHILLAINNKEIIHVTNVKSNDNSNATIKIESFQYIVNKNNYDHCQILTSFYDTLFAKIGNIYPLTKNEIVAKALQYENKIVSYDFNINNCEHWVTLWRYNITRGISVQDILLGLHPLYGIIRDIKKYLS